MREQTRRRVQRFRERTRVVVIIAVLALALSPMPAGAREQPRSGAAMPFASPGNSPSGYYQSGGFCAPTNRDNRPAVPRPAGAQLPQRLVSIRWGLREAQSLRRCGGGNTLRVCPGTSSGITKFSEHEAD